MKNVGFGYGLQPFFSRVKSVQLSVCIAELTDDGKVFIDDLIPFITADLMTY